MILARFADEAAMTHAASDLAARRLGQVETYMAMEPHGGAQGSLLPLAMLGGGLLGGIGGFAMQAYATTISYPQDIGGRPNLSWPAYIPATFELAVLGAVVTGIVGYLYIARLPRLYDPIDDADIMRETMRGGYVLAIEPTDAAQVRAALCGHAPIEIEEMTA
jgi:Protein of unknown function (DUF3341)